MARRPRLHVPGGFYHVTLRGNHRNPIFFRKSDRDLLERIVADSLLCCDARLHAYCWMTNHIHMVIQVSDVPLGKIVLRTASIYARRIQHHLETTGHLFERRYHAVLVDADHYLLTLLRYVHLNPMRAGLVRDPGEYPWSSHRAYLGGPAPRWLTTEFALALLSPHLDSAIARYRGLIRNPEPLVWNSGMLKPNLSHPQILGGDAFVARIAGPRVPAAARSLDQLLEDCCNRFRVPRAELVSPRIGRHLAKARAWLAHQATRAGIASNTDVARLLGRSEGAIRQAMQRYPDSNEDATQCAEKLRILRPGT
jgi:putative transposase